MSEALTSRRSSGQSLKPLRAQRVGVGFRVQGKGSTVKGKGFKGFEGLKGFGGRFRKGYCTLQPPKRALYRIDDGKYQAE